MDLIRNFAKKITMKNCINNKMPDQTIGITKIVRAAKALKQINNIANAMTITINQGPLHHNIIMKK